MAALARHKPRPLAAFAPAHTRAKYQYIRMKDMIRSALGAPPGVAAAMNNPFGNPPGSAAGSDAGMLAFRSGLMGAPPSASSEGFPGSAGLGGFPMGGGGGMDGAGGGGVGTGGGLGRRQSGIMAAGGGAGGGAGGAGSGPRQILPGQLPGPGGQRKSSLSAGGS